ncbi:MAG: hypothetical protein U1F28_03505 [Acinetobacter sp.]
MLIRTSLNSAYTTGVDQYGDVYLDNINQNLLKQFLDHITVYLKAYPNGQYVASARGFMRQGHGFQNVGIYWSMRSFVVAIPNQFYNLEMNQLPAKFIVGYLTVNISMLRI